MADGFGRRPFLAMAATVPLMTGGRLWAKSAEPVVTTTQGKARGIISQGVFAFKGLRYGSPTGGANRFKPAQPPEPWQGVRDFFDYGARAPQNRPKPSPDSPLASWIDPTESGEDCLRLNIWTPTLEPREKLPVMVWLHGGGFSSGSGSTNVYAGHNLAKGRDVVVVTVNHRLNIFGHLSLGHLDPAYADSGNVGILDIVAALRWVKANIVGFGGDPSRVMIFGESGGGAKVCSLMAMPSAQGLFHAAVCESGPMVWGVTPEDARGAAAVVLDKMKVAPGNLAKLQTLTMEEIMAAFEGAGPEWLRSFSPVIGGSLPTHPFADTAPAFSKNIPMIIGMTRDEATILNPAPANFTLNWESLTPAMTKVLNSDSAAVIAGYRALHPDYSPSDIFFAAMTQHMLTRNAFHVADMRVASGAKDTWMYSLEWRTPVKNGIYRAPHTLEIPFVFDTVKDSPSLLPDNQDTQYLSRLCGDLWTSMAAKRQPKSKLAHWPRYTAKRETLMINTPPMIQNDPRADERALLKDIAPFNICGRGVPRPS